MASNSEVISDDSAIGGSKLRLYSFFRSSCSWRVRIALHLKGLKYEYKAVNLLKGEQFSPEFSKLNPLSYVPVLVDGDIVISDSFAIILYLEEKYPEHPLLPCDIQKRAINFQAANIVSSSIQPLQNYAALNYIEEKVNANEKLVWVQYHIGKGFAEKLLKGNAGRYVTGDQVFLYVETLDLLKIRLQQKQGQVTTAEAGWIICPTFNFLMAYLSYMLAELFHLSAILTVFFCGIVMSHYTWHNVTESSRITTNLGKSVGVSSMLIALVMVGRAAFVFPLSLLSNSTKRSVKDKIGFKQQMIVMECQLDQGCTSLEQQLNTNGWI